MNVLAVVPFTVTAYLQQGAALDARYGVALDGLLASQVRVAMARWLAADGEPLPGSLLDGGLSESDPVDTPLPLVTCQQGPAWHWMATTAQPVDHDGAALVPDVDVHFANGRLDHKLAEVVALRIPPSLPAGSGRYRSRRLPVVTVPAAGLRWRGVGDPDAVRALLEPLSTVGARRGTGEGAVLRWDVTGEPEGDPGQFGHLHGDGTLGRPSPLECAERLAVTGVGQGFVGLRPPYWHASRQHVLVLPGYEEGQRHAAP